jgi:hypothetical protein
MTSWQRQVPHGKSFILPYYHAYLTYTNCDSLSCSKTGPSTALLKFICAFTRIVNIQVVWSRTVLSSTMDLRGKI